MSENLQERVVNIKVIGVGGGGSSNYTYAYSEEFNENVSTITRGFTVGQTNSGISYVDTDTYHSYRIRYMGKANLNLIINPPFSIDKRWIYLYNK